MFHRLLLCVLVSSCILFTSCLKQFCTITLKSDLSGTYTIRNKINIDSVAKIAFSIAKVSGDKRFKSLKFDQFKLLFSTQLSTSSLKEQRKELEKKLPKGVKLIELRKKQEKDEKNDIFVVDMKFSFDSLDSLKKMNSLDVSAMEIIKKQVAKMGQRVPSSMFKKQGLPYQLDIDESGKMVIFTEQESPRYTKNELQGLSSIIPGIIDIVDAGYSRLAIKLSKKYSIVENNAYKIKKTKYYWRKGLIAKDSDKKMLLKLKKK